MNKKSVCIFLCSQVLVWADHFDMLRLLEQRTDYDLLRDAASAPPLNNRPCLTIVVPSANRSAPTAFRAGDWHARAVSQYFTKEKANTPEQLWGMEQPWFRDFSDKSLLRLELRLDPVPLLLMNQYRRYKYYLGYNLKPLSGKMKEEAEER